MDAHAKAWIDVKSSTEKETLGHRYLIVTYVTIEGAAGSTRMWSYELADWLTSKPGTMIVNLREIA